MYGAENGEDCAGVPVRHLRCYMRGLLIDQEKEKMMI